MNRSQALKPSILLVGNFLSAKGMNQTMAEEFAQYLESAGYFIVTTSKRRSRPLRLLDMLFTTFLRRNAYQVSYVEVYSGGAFLWAELVCELLKFLKKPYVLTLHGGNLPIFAKQNPGRVISFLKKAKAVTAPSHYLQEAMYPYRADIVLIPNPLEIKNYPFRLRVVPKPRLIWLRAFHNIYNPQMAPLVISNLRIYFPEITLTMVGPDKMDGSLQETQAVIKKLGLETLVKIVPGISKREVPAYLANADVFINTTNIDNAPISVLEAMGCGLCVVSTNVGGIPYLLKDGQNAILVPPNDPQAMANTVCRVLMEPGLAEVLSREARKKVEQFDWKIILQHWENLFQEIL